MLTESATAGYQTSGFLVVEDALSTQETEILSSRVSEIERGILGSFPEADIEREPPPGRSSTSAELSESRAQTRAVRKLNRCAQNDPLFLNHARHPRLLDIVEQLIGPDIKLFDSQCFMKPPGGIEKPYHQDSAYFTIQPQEMVTCWTALDDVTLDNGCLWVIPGSHRQGLVDHGQEWFVGDRPDKQVPDSSIDRSNETPITMHAGGCSFHHSLLLHRSGPNHSTQPRRGLAVHYMSARSVWTHPTEPQPDYLLLRGREYPGCV